MKLDQVLVLTVCLIVNSHAQLGRPKINRYGIVRDPGEPLILTSYLEENKTEEARNLAKVTYDGFFGVESYAGYFTVDKTFDSNLFFWFFPSENDYATDPVLLWLNGGPGTSSIHYGLFVENGAFQIINETAIKLREYRWSRNNSILYFDSPAGTGYSFTNGGYADNETKVGEDLYTAIAQFYQLFPELKENDFFLTGESYCGKYIPAIGYTILNKNDEAETKINLKGLAIGDGVTDPYHQFIYSDYLAGVGLVDSTQQEQLRNLEDIMRNAIVSEDFRKGIDTWHLLTATLTNITGVNIYNYVLDNMQDVDYAEEFLQGADIREAIHVGNTTWSDEEVFNHLEEDMVKNVTEWVEILLEHYPLLIYTGQWDIILNYPTTEIYLANLNSSSVSLFKNATRSKYYVQNGEDLEIAGYVKQGGNLTDILIRNAGHLVPYEQPIVALDLINRFTRNLTLGFSTNGSTNANVSVKQRFIITYMDNFV